MIKKQRRIEKYRTKFINLRKRCEISFLLLILNPWILIPQDLDIFRFNPYAELFLSPTYNELASRCLIDFVIGCYLTGERGRERDLLNVHPRSISTEVGL